MKRSLLWISPYVPYDTVDHAGGKNHNYYIKYFQASGKFDITLLTLAYKKQVPKIDLDTYGIKYKISVISDDIFGTLLRYAVNLESEFSPFNKFCGVFSNFQRYKLIKLIERYASEVVAEPPEVIVLQWTHTILLMPLIRRLFPKSKIVAIEEDVVFLSYQRKMHYVTNRIKKRVYRYKFNKIKKMELEVLNDSDLIVVNNMKDKTLLLEAGLKSSKIVIGAIYYDDYSSIKRNVKNNYVIYYGAMKRKENYLSALWFIERVMPLISDNSVKFLVIGGGATKKLKGKENDRIKILGFVDDLEYYFSESLCMVAPLVLGAGIKVKVLEGFSAGIPVLTNDIGIEGIFAVDGKEYIHCVQPEEYASAIMKLIDKPEKGRVISENSRQFIKANFEKDTKLKDLVNIVWQI